MEKEILWNLESGEANLQDDIQALSYIQDTCITKSGENWLTCKPEIQNQLQTLLKSMIYNHENMLKAVNNYYENIKKREVKE